MTIHAKILPAAVDDQRPAGPPWRATRFLSRRRGEGEAVDGEALAPNPAAIRATDGIGVLAGPRAAARRCDGMDGDKYEPLDSERLLSEVDRGHPLRLHGTSRAATNGTATNA
jgi:hypothetical protein